MKAFGLFLLILGGLIVVADLNNGGQLLDILYSTSNSLVAAWVVYLAPMFTGLLMLIYRARRLSD